MVDIAFSIDPFPTLFFWHACLLLSWYRFRLWDRRYNECDADR